MLPVPALLARRAPLRVRAPLTLRVQDLVPGPATPSKATPSQATPSKASPRRAPRHSRATLLVRVRLAQVRRRALTFPATDRCFSQGRPESWSGSGLRLTGFAR